MLMLDISGACTYKSPRGCRINPALEAKRLFFVPSICRIAVSVNLFFLMLYSLLHFSNGRYIGGFAATTQRDSGAFMQNVDVTKMRTDRWFVHNFFKSPTVRRSVYSAAAYVIVGVNTPLLIVRREEWQIPHSLAANLPRFVNTWPTLTAVCHNP